MVVPHNIWKRWFCCVAEIVRKCAFGRKSKMRISESIIKFSIAYFRLIGSNQKKIASMCIEINEKFWIFACGAQNVAYVGMLWQTDSINKWLKTTFFPLSTGIDKVWSAWSLYIVVHKYWCLEPIEIWPWHTSIVSINFEAFFFNFSLREFSISWYFLLSMAMHIVLFCFRAPQGCVEVKKCMQMQSKYVNNHLNEMNKRNGWSRRRWKIEKHRS